MAFSIQDIPDQTGRNVIITGGNSGLGQQTAMELCRKGANVTISCRSKAKGNQAMAKILVQIPAAKIDVGVCDLSDLSSIKSFCTCYLQTHERLDIFIANAGVVKQPEYTTTKDNQELMMQANYLGHFLMTELLMPLLLKADAPRFAAASTLQSTLAKTQINYQDFQWVSRNYSAGQAYHESRFAQLLHIRYINQRLSSCKGTAVAFMPGLVQRPEEHQEYDRLPGFLRLFRVPIETAVVHPLQAATDASLEPNTSLQPFWIVQGEGVPKPFLSTVTAEAAQELYEFSMDLAKDYL